MFDRLRNGIKGVINRMFGRTSFSAAVLPETAITDDMATAIDHWVALYYNNAPWLTGNRLTLGLPSAIARELATLVTLEAKISVGNVAVDDSMEDDTDPNAELNPRAAFISESLKPLLAQITVQTEYACAFGGIAFRPYIDGKRIAIDCINADNFYPTAFNARGEITGAIFVEKKRKGKETYTRVEQHSMGDNGAYLITNRAFKSYGESDVGTPCNLSDVDEWADIDPEIPINGVDYPLFSYFRIPHGNVVDVDSNLGVSVYARADSAGTLEEADKQYQRLSWEYGGGELAIDASVDAFRPDEHGRPVLPVGKERLFRVNELSGADDSGEKFKVYAPTLRDESFAAGLNRLLMRVEDQCGIARGTFSDANEQVRTATELRTNKQRTYATVSSIQEALKEAIKNLARAVDTLATLYNLAPKGEYAISFAMDDSIVIDAETERECDRQDVLDGIMQAWEYRVKWYGETPSKAKAAVSKTKDKPVRESIDRTVDEPEISEE